MTQDEAEHIIRLAQLLARRLERLSVDSAWAHKASGLRGGLLRGLDAIEGPLSEAQRQNLLAGIKQLNLMSFRVLVRAARELHPNRRPDETPKSKQN